MSNIIKPKVGIWLGMFRGMGGSASPSAAGGTDFTADANCMGAWLFASGVELVDSSGEGNTLTNNGTTTFSATSIPYSTNNSGSQKAVFNGSSQSLIRTYANLSANMPGKATKTSFAFALWIKHDDAATAAESPFNSTLTMQTGYRGYVAGYNDYSVRVRDSASDTDEQSILNNDDSLTWTHLIFSFVGGSPNGVGTVWISRASFGDIVNGTTFNYAAIDNVGQDGSQWALTIGSGGTAGDASYFDGEVFQPIIFDISLSSAQATEIFTYGIKGLDAL